MNQNHGVSPACLHYTSLRRPNTLFSHSMIGLISFEKINCHSKKNDAAIANKLYGFGFQDKSIISC